MLIRKDRGGLLVEGGLGAEAVEVVGAVDSAGEGVVVQQDRGQGDEWVGLMMFEALIAGAVARDVLMAK
jgi:hypothetical protein